MCTKKKKKHYEGINKTSEGYEELVVYREIFMK